MSDASMKPNPSLNPVKPVKWEHHSFGQRLLRYLLWIFCIWAIVQSVRYIEVIPEFLYDAPEQMADMLGRMWPIDWTYFQPDVLQGLMETLHMATLGTVLSLFLALPLGVMVAPNITKSRTLNFIARVLLVASRSVNSLVWAMLFVAIFGPGPLAGMFAIALRSVGFVGKLIGEALEQTPKGSIEALQAAGASQFAQLWYGYWPQIKPAFWSVALLRWDINVRESGVLGLVGAGGIGVVLNTCIDLFQWDRVALVLFTILVVVAVAEIVVLQIRKRVL
ncbi:phosphonate ABC transporter, permease protein PhnE [Diaphorobacter sp. HDW4A]|uniref:phosphonate ABC transporter, permease protein PhnE n=1 Tax=Diaphorobacter sp. HDW4A TaxID=2714924 RepID=UPI00140AAA16|nr:phosphonate ABC transporter, permease protein PhnE [Diaphorobacter sp. HDW4A]QIL83152.1 phosphonate ABC transporter, permease protein PhnE [Diaphorobacter sp. HDW4A]